jgi:hypothetical protein
MARALTIGGCQATWDGVWRLSFARGGGHSARIFHFIVYWGLKGTWQGPWEYENGLWDFSIQFRERPDQIAFIHYHQNHSILFESCRCRDSFALLFVFFGWLVVELCRSEGGGCHHVRHHTNRQPTPLPVLLIAQNISYT